MSKIKDKNFYNSASSLKLGWLPSWLNCQDFDDNLVEKIKEFQSIHGLEIDGCLGPQTFKILYTLNEAKLYAIEMMGQKKKLQDDKKYIICNGEKIIINWDKVDITTFKHTKGFRGNIGGKRDVKTLILHHDAALSSKSCFAILEKRGLSIHFMVDTDGTIYQALDCNFVAQHASECNSFSIGVEINNAVEKKYQKYYESKGFGKRPELSEKIHDCKYSGMGLYDIQKEALVELSKAICNYYNIPIETPQDEEGGELKQLYKPAIEGNFRGICCHYHCNKEKWDCFGLNIQKDIINKLK